MQRLQLIESDITNSIEQLIDGIKKKFEKHGYGAYLSNHEALGIITEEFYELVGAIQSNDNSKVYEELIDVAVGSVIAVASMVAGSRTIAANNSEIDLARQAREKMIERAKKSGLVIEETTLS